MYLNTNIKCNTHHSQICPKYDHSMGLDDLLPANTKRARATAVNAFLGFIQSEDVDLETIILYLAILETRAGGWGGAR